MKGVFLDFVMRKKVRGPRLFYLFPVFGLIQTFIVFREIPSLMVTLGGIIVIGSVFIIQKIK